MPLQDMAFNNHLLFNRICQLVALKEEAICGRQSTSLAELPVAVRERENWVVSDCGSDFKFVK